VRVIVCGSRGWTDPGPVQEALAALPAESTVVHGAARGADSIAARIAVDLGLPVEAHPAQWDKWGRSAGPRRNAEMAALGADLCLAFRLTGPSPGTDDMVRRCRALGIPVRAWHMLHAGAGPGPLP